MFGFTKDNWIISSLCIKLVVLVMYIEGNIFKEHFVET